MRRCLRIGQCTLQTIEKNEFAFFVMLLRAVTLAASTVGDILALDSFSVTEGAEPT